MNNILSSQRTTNVLMVILVAVMFIFFVRFEIRVSKIQRSVQYGISNEGVESYLKEISRETDKIYILLEGIENNTR